MIQRKRVNKELLKRWGERVRMIQRGALQLGDTEEERTARIECAKRDYNYFCRTYFPHLAKSECADFHVDAASKIAANSYLTALFEWARGHAKSSHISCLTPLWLLARGQADFNFLILVSKSYDAAVGLLGDLQAELSNNEAYKRDFGISVEGDEWRSGKFSLLGGITFVALGRGQSPRGLKKGGQRPDYIVIDDIDDDELADNEARVRKAYKWVMTALYGTMAVGRGRFICVGNRIAKISILSLIAEIKGIYHTRVNLLDDKGNISWHQNYTPEDVARVRETVGELNFWREYQNTPITEGAVFKQEYFRWGRPLDLKRYRRLICYTDPSWRGTKKNDYKATILVGKTREGSYHVLKAYAAQTSVATMVQWHYEIESYVDGVAPVRYHMESNFIQDLLLKEFRSEGLRREHQIAITPDKRKKPDKYARIEALQPLFERGEVLFSEGERESEGMRVLIEQLLAIEPGSKMHDDAPDALEGAIWLLNRGETGGGRRYAVSHRADRRY